MRFLVLATALFTLSANAINAPHSNYNKKDAK